MHYVYIVRCSDGSLYTGYARDPALRAEVHNLGRGARYTSGRRPVHLVYSEVFESAGEALRREHRLKQWTRARKEVLIAASACGAASGRDVTRPLPGTAASTPLTPGNRIKSRSG